MNSASLAPDGRSVCGWNKDLAEKARRAVLNLGEVGHLHHAALRCEGKRPLAALNLGNPEDLMIAGIIGGNRATIVDHQATGFGEIAYRRSFWPPTAAGWPNPFGHRAGGGVSDR